jgi:hypothetical protein
MPDPMVPRPINPTFIDLSCKVRGNNRYIYVSPVCPGGVRS